MEASRATIKHYTGIEFGGGDENRTRHTDTASIHRPLDIHPQNWSLVPDSNRLPPPYKGGLHHQSLRGIGRTDEIRTRDLSVISRVLLPTELRSYCLAGTVGLEPTYNALTVRPPTEMVHMPIEFGTP